MFGMEYGGADTVAEAEEVQASVRSCKDRGLGLWLGGRQDGDYQLCRQLLDSEGQSVAMWRP